MPVEFLMIDVLFCGCTACIEFHSLQGNKALGIGEKLALGRRMWHEAQSKQSETHCDCTFYEEDPWPSVVATMLDLSQAGCQEAAKGAAERRGAIEEANSIQHLMSFVEHGEVDYHAA